MVPAAVPVWFALEKRVLTAAAAISLAVLVWMQLGGEQVIPLFLKEEDSALLDMTLRAMELFSLSYLLGWVSTCLSSFFTALNRPGLSLVLAFSRTLVFPLLSLLVLPGALGLDGVWLISTSTGVLTAHSLPSLSSPCPPAGKASVPDGLTSLQAILAWGLSYFSILQSADIW